MHFFNSLLKYLVFISKAHSRSGHGIHSPFVYDLVSRVFNNSYPDFEAKSKHWRRSINRDKTKIVNENFGAGSCFIQGRETTAGKLAGISGLPHTYGMLLYKLCREFKPSVIVELGTSLGVSTYYLAHGSPDTPLITMEGSPRRSGYARSAIRKEGLFHVKFLVGNFDDLLPGLEKQLSDPLLVFIDGNHKFEPTIRYFNFFLQYVKENTIIIFDDIHWSTGMENAWKVVSTHEKVSVSIDLFRCGVVFFKKGLSKENFLIKYA